MKKIIVCSLLFCLVCGLSAQKKRVYSVDALLNDTVVSNQSIEMRGLFVYRNNERISYREYNDYVAEVCPGAFQFSQPKLAYNYLDFTAITTISGGVILSSVAGICYPLCSEQKDKNKMQSMAVAGGALAACGIIMGSISLTHRYFVIKKSVAIYNNHCSTPSVAIVPFIAPNQVGVALTF